jgi:hypothetical protein
MADNDVMVFMCGPSTAQCKCGCGNGGPCEHKWDGPVRELDPATEGYGATVTCSRCGMDAMAHDMWVIP